MKKVIKSQQIWEDVGAARKLIETENDAFRQNVLEPSQKSFQDLLSYVENQFNNMKEYAQHLQKLCKNDQCRAYLETQIDELNSVKSKLDKSIASVLYPVEEPSLNPNGYMAYFFSASCPILGELTYRLIKVHHILDSLHDTL